MSDEKFVVSIELDDGTIKRGFARIQKNAKNTGEKAGKDFSEGFSVGIAGIAAGAIAAIGAIRGLTSSVSSVFRASSSLEEISTRFRVLTGSVSEANKQIKDLTNFAAETPFQLEDLANASARLQAFGFEADGIIDRLRTLGDIAAGSGADLGEISLILGQISAAGKLTGERLLQLEERGIVLGPTLAKNLGVAESSIRELVSAGKIGLGDVEQAFEDLTAEGAIFANATQLQAQTLGGLVSTLADNFFALKVAIGEALGPLFKAVLNETINLVKEFTGSIAEFTSEAGNVEMLTDGIIKLGFAINDFVIRPLEILANVGGVVFDAIEAGVAAITAGFAQLGGVIGLVLEATGLNEKLGQELQAFAEATRNVVVETAEDVSNGLADVFETGFADRTEQFIEGVRETVDRINEETARTKKIEPISQEGLDNLKSAGDALTKTTSGIAKKATFDLNNRLAGGISNGIQNITNSILQGEDAFANFGKFLLATFGDLAIQLGTFFIAQGIAIEALNAISGTGAIAAGAALVALGTILKSFTGGADSGLGATSGGGLVGGGGGFTPTNEEGAVLTDEIEREEAGTQVQVVVQGDVFDSEETGLRIASIVEENFDKKGIQVIG